MSIVGVRRHRSLCEEPGNTQTEVRWEEEGGGKKKKKKKVEMWRENETEKKKAPLVFVFLFPALLFPPPMAFQLGSKHLSALRRRWWGGESAEGLVCGRPGPGISGAARLGTSALFICPDPAFPARLRDLPQWKEPLSCRKNLVQIFTNGGRMQRRGSQPARRAVKNGQSAFLNNPLPHPFPFT